MGVLGQTYLGAEGCLLVEVAVSELAVLACCDDAVTVDAHTAGATSQLTRHVLLGRTGILPADLCQQQQDLHTNKHR